LETPALAHDHGDCAAQEDALALLDTGPGWRIITGDGSKTPPGLDGGEIMCPETPEPSAVTEMR
jgi:hypothetical protein